MTHTTPPRRHDILEHIPELAEYADSAVRLHPRQGKPGIDESSVGGPLLWPAGEPWPMCTLQHDVGSDQPVDYVFARREYLRDRTLREKQGEKLDWDAERRRMSELRLEHSHDDHADSDVAAPQPLIPVAQLYYRDVPGLPWADRFDLLQILWCPHDHPDADTPYNPVFQLRWRETKEAGATLQSPPRPVTCYSEYLPNQCVVHPEVVTEYPHIDALPEKLRRAVRDWEDGRGNSTDYYRDTAVAPGWKVMGHGGYWGIIDPYPLMCECGREQLPLFTATSGEFDGGTKSWQPIEEAGLGSGYSDPVEVTIGRGYKLQLYYCPDSAEHTNRTEMF